MIIVHAANPSRLVEAAFLRIQAESMAGVPILNRALRVEAIGFTSWQGRWLGVLVTPWCMNLMLLPATATDWTSIAEHERLFYHFPAGDLAFLCGEQPELGEYHSCALYSPMAQFHDQDSARAVASEALIALMNSADQPADAHPVESPTVAIKPATPAESTEPTEPIEPIEPRAPKPGMSKREFFSKIFPRILP